MARYENRITTLQARTINECIEQVTEKMENRETIEKVSTEIINMLEKTFSEKFPVENENAFFAFTLSTCAKIAVKRGDLKILDYITILADVKEENEEEISDFGAFGDLFEILIRCAFMRNLSLVRWSSLTVKSIEKSDMISKKYGIVEIGHNGKSFTYGTLFDFMSGEYTSIVYGVFSPADKKEIYSLCRKQQFNKAIDYVTSYSVYWANKYDFQKDMDSLTRGKGIAVKGDCIQVVYNSGKYNAFVNAIENGVFASLFETLKR